MTAEREKHAKTKRKLGAPALLVALLVALGGAGCSKSKAEPSPEKPAAESPAVSVETIGVEEAEVPTFARLPGNLKGERETELAANAMGRVMKTHVERGDRVKKGQILAELDVRDAALSANQARAEVASAKVQEEQAKIECARYEQLKKTGAVSDAEYQARITQCRSAPLVVDAARARADLAAKTISDGKVRAPFDGVVAERFIEVGQYVRQDTRVAVVISLDQLRVEFAVPEADIARVKEDLPVTLRVGAFPDRGFTATVKYVAGSINPATRDLTVEALVDNTEGLLKSGMFADVEISTGTRKLPAVPRSALVERDGQPHAFFVVDGRLEERVLSLGPAVGDRVGVLKGAKLGEQIATGEVAKLKNGDRASGSPASKPTAAREN